MLYVILIAAILIFAIVFYDKPLAFTCSRMENWRVVKAIQTNSLLIAAER